MPLTISSVSRRRFLQVAGVGVGWLAVRPVLAADVDAQRIALLADTHIPETPDSRGPHDCSMVERMRSAMQEISQLNPKPACAIVAGDLAWKTGTPAEYAAFRTELQPLHKAGVPVHLALGNHDLRETFLTAFKADAPKQRPVDDKHVLVVELPLIDLVILDSLDVPESIPGACGEAQLKWLAEVLGRNSSKPAIAVIHHNPQWPGPNEKLIGLKDTTGLWETLKSHPRLKAIVFGHLHTWRLDQKDDLHLINLPAVGFPFDPKGVSGWVDLKLSDRGATVTVQAFDRTHADHRKTHDLRWR